MQRLHLKSILLILYYCITTYTDGACTFPGELSGTWYSSHKGALDFNSSYLTGYPIYMSATTSSLDFTCDESSGNLYMLKSTEAVLAFGNLIDAYLCIEIHRVSAYKYYYYIGTNIASTNNDHIYGRTTGTVVTMSEACSRTVPYETGTYIILVKDGAVPEGYGDATCPTELLAFYTNITVYNAGGSTSCTGNSVDGCSESSILQYTYAGCSTSLVFSSTGLFYCLYHVTSNDIKYLSVWNNDSTVDGTSTYRFTCYAIQASGNTIYATEYPGFCSDASQDSTTVSSPGISIIMTKSNTTCNSVTVEDGVYHKAKGVTVEDGVYGGWIALIIILALGLIAAVALATVIFIRHQKHKRSVLPSTNACRICGSENGDPNDSKSRETETIPLKSPKAAKVTRISSIRAIAPQQLPNEVHDNPAFKDGEDQAAPPATSARLPPLTPKGDDSQQTENSIQPKLPPIKQTKKSKKK